MIELIITRVRDFAKAKTLFGNENKRRDRLWF